MSNSGAEWNVTREHQWSLDDFPPRARFAAWCEILGAAHLAFATDRTSEWQGGFGARIREHGLGPMSLLEVSVKPHRGRRTRRHVRANTRDVIGLHFVRSGRQAIDLGREKLVLGPGEAVLWDGAATGGYEVLEPLEKVALIVPRVVAATLLPSYRNSFVKPLPGDHPPTRSLIRLLSLLSEQLPLMDDGARRAASLLVAEMLKPLDGPLDGGPVRREGASRFGLRERVLDYIDRNLADPTLNSTAIALAHAVSVRTLYSALEGLGVTPGRYIRDRRLARSYEDLLFGDDPVGTVALSNGFTSAAHFSTVFRERYGLSPSEMRRRRG